MQGLRTCLWRTYICTFTRLRLFVRGACVPEMFPHQHMHQKTSIRICVWVYTPEHMYRCGINLPWNGFSVKWLVCAVPFLMMRWLETEPQIRNKSLCDICINVRIACIVMRFLMVVCKRTWGECVSTHVRTIMYTQVQPLWSSQRVVPSHEKFRWTDEIPSRIRTLRLFWLRTVCTVCIFTHRHIHICIHHVCIHTFVCTHTYTHTSHAYNTSDV